MCENTFFCCVFICKKGLKVAFFVVIGSRYCPMLEKEGGADIMLELINNPSTDENVVSIAQKILAFGKSPSVQRVPRDDQMSAPVPCPADEN